MMRICDFKNHYTRCKKGWVYMPDGMGCVQSELCPKCDGEGQPPMKDEEQDELLKSRKPHGYQYYQTFAVTLHVTYAKSYTIRAMNDEHAMDIAARRVAKRHKHTDNKGLGFVKAVPLDAKLLGKD